MKRMENRLSFARGVRILAVASILGLASCGDDPGGGMGGMGGAGGRGGNAGRGGAGGRGGSGGGATAGTGGSSIAGSGGGATAGSGGGTAGAGGATAGSAGGTAGAGGGTAGAGGATAGSAGGTAGAGGATAGSAGGTAGASGGSGGADPDGGSDAPAGAANGAVCTMAADCASGYCVDGVCCEAACTGDCSACVAAKTGEASGLCRPITNGTDPDDECPQDPTASCGRDGQCDGAGACRAWGSGITCAVQACNGSTYTPARTCNGAGVCQTVNNMSCGAYMCGAATCKTMCVSTGDCTAGNFCTSAGACSPQKDNGFTCVAGDECASGFCVDGYCCQEACNGACQACSGAKTGQANGICLPITGGTDPDNECPQDAASSCGLDGQCNGAGACRYWGTSTVCVGESCLGMTYTPARTCNGGGACQTVTPRSCDAYVCGTSACKTSCTSITDCASGFFCSTAGNCVTLKANGAVCGAPDECTSGACIDGVCCETACTSGCFACSAAKTTQADGLCRPIIGGTDPDNECTASSAMSCGLDGSCDGAGACRMHVANTVCVAATCVGSTFTAAGICNGAGTCTPPTGTSSCAPYNCGAAACLAACAGDGDCIDGYYCLGTTCTIKETNGTACDAAGECASGFCVDGVCCDNACTGTCQTCGQTGSVGTCTAADNNTDPRNECDPTDASTCGNDGMCDGAGACRKHAAGTQCAAASCSAATLHAASTCDGAGTCNAGAATSCNNFQCNGAVCGTSCTMDSECTGFCSAGACYPSSSLVNLAGNGDLEYGATNGWQTNGGGLTLQNAGTSPSTVYAGTYAVAGTGRTANFNGPAYPIPTGAGIYKIRARVMQNENDSQAVGLQVNTQCGTATTTGNPFPGLFATLIRGEWAEMVGTVNLATAHATCDPLAATPGSVRSAVLYLNQTAAGSTVAFPNLYIDNVVVQVDDGHNLVGNPNFEAGSTAGWQNNGNGALSISSTVFRPGGAGSLQHSGRMNTYNGPRWTLPLGAAKYNVTFYALHSGALPHDLVLQPTYTCAAATPAAVFPPPIAIASQAGGNGWNTLSGTVTFPPAGAAAGCKLISAAIYVQQEGGTCGAGVGQIECPDLFVDDVSITLAP
jgi:hypothetical protein